MQRVYRSLIAIGLLAIMVSVLILAPPSRIGPRWWATAYSACGTARRKSLRNRPSIWGDSSCYRSSQQYQQPKSYLRGAGLKTSGRHNAHCYANYRRPNNPGGDYPRPNYAPTARRPKQCMWYKLGKICIVSPCGMAQRFRPLAKSTASLIPIWSLLGCN